MRDVTVEGLFGDVFLQGPGPPGLGVLNVRQKNMVMSPMYSGSRITALVRTSSNCKLQTRPLVRESAKHLQTRNYLTVIETWTLNSEFAFLLINFMSLLPPSDIWLCWLKVAEKWKWNYENLRKARGKILCFIHQCPSPFLRSQINACMLAKMQRALLFFCESIVN
jgi:hypothetical protein